MPNYLNLRFIHVCWKVGDNDFFRGLGGSIGSCNLGSRRIRSCSTSSRVSSISEHLSFRRGTTTTGGFASNDNLGKGTKKKTVQTRHDEKLETTDLVK